MTTTTTSIIAHTTFFLEVQAVHALLETRKCGETQLRVQRLAVSWMGWLAQRYTWTAESPIGAT
jgi:hypothetical protein